MTAARAREPALRLVDDRPARVGDHQIQVFVALFYMYGYKIGAMKYTTGTK